MLNQNKVKVKVEEAYKIWYSSTKYIILHKIPKLYFVLELCILAGLITLGIYLFLQTTSCNLKEKRLYTRKEAAEYMKPHIQAVSKLYAKHFTCNIQEIEIVLALLIISETSAPNSNGKWYPLSSTLYDVNNLFGIKANKDKLDKGEFVVKQTWEEYNGKKTIIYDKFATFNSLEECITWWFNKICYSSRYKKVRESEHYAEALIQLQVCGYMTDSKYPQKMLNIAKANKIPQVFR